MVGGWGRGPVDAGLDALVGQALAWPDRAPAARARSTRGATVPLPMPRLAATARWLCPRPHFCRKSLGSGAWLRSVAIAPFLGTSLRPTSSAAVDPAILPGAMPYPSPRRVIT